MNQLEAIAVNQATIFELVGHFAERLTGGRSAVWARLTDRPELAVTSEEC